VPPHTQTFQSIWTQSQQLIPAFLAQQSKRYAMEFEEHQRALVRQSDSEKVCGCRWSVFALRCACIIREARSSASVTATQSSLACHTACNFWRGLQAAEAETRERNSIRELEDSRVRASMWRKDPLHAKLSILKDLANIQRCVTQDESLLLRLALISSVSHPELMPTHVTPQDVAFILSFLSPADLCI
jgi:hypothetical protein